MRNSKGHLINEGKAKIHLKRSGQVISKTLWRDADYNLFIKFDGSFTQVDKINGMYYTRF